MWNLIYNPSENGAALLPVSRDWNFAPTPANDDWTYAVFDWCALWVCFSAWQLVSLFVVREANTVSVCARLSA